MKKKAFTLIEVLVVLVILSILFIVLVSKVDFSVTQSKEMTVSTDFLAYQLAIEEVCLEKKDLVADMATLRDNLNIYLEHDLMVEADGGSLKTNKTDPWGTTYYLEYTRTNNDKGKIIITSAGVDMTFGTEDDLTMSVAYQNTPYGYKVVKESDI